MCKYKAHLQASSRFCQYLFNTSYFGLATNLNSGRSRVGSRLTSGKKEEEKELG